MKATFEFNLPEEQSEFEMFNNAYKYHSVLWDLSQYLRGKIKYEDLTEEKEIIYQEIRNKLGELLSEKDVSL